MMEILFILLLLAVAVYVVIRKFKKTDEQLKAERAAREAQMLAAAYAWRNSQQGREKDQGDPTPPAG